MLGRAVLARRALRNIFLLPVTKIGGIEHFYLFVELDDVRGCLRGVTYAF